MQVTDHKARHCPNCGGLLAEESKFCGVCGAPTPPRQVGFCSVCGAPVMEGQEACYSCGSKVNVEPPLPPEPAKAPAVRPRKEKAPRKKKKTGTGVWVGILATLLVAIIAVAVALLFQPKNAESVTLERTSLTLLYGQRATLEYRVLPENLPDKSVSWSTSDPSVATVKNGEVVATGNGVCHITVTAREGVYAVCTVKVVSETVRELVLSHTDLSMHVGDTVTLQCQVLPEDAHAELVWSSDNENVVCVDQGTLTAVGVGECTVKVTAGDGVSVSCSLAVAARDEERLPLGTWELSRIDDRFSETSSDASGSSLVLKLDLTGTMVQDGAAKAFQWKFAHVDSEGDYWYDTDGLAEDSAQIVYSADDDVLSLYGPDETWVFTR